MAFSCDNSFDISWTVSKFLWKKEQKMQGLSDQLNILRKCVQGAVDESKLQNVTSL